MELHALLAEERETEMTIMLDDSLVDTETGRTTPVTLKMENVCAYYGEHQAVADVTMKVEPKRVTALIGPSGCGKSTLLRSINRLHETIPGARVSGRILLGADDLYGPRTDPVDVRARVGMVFQRANPFPTMSIRDNVLAGVRLRGDRLSRAAGDEITEKALRDVALWDEVKDCLNKSGVSISGGQQQRLCIARAIAVKPEVLLMDEPCSALDPASTLAIENLMTTLRQDYTVVIVTHNMAQAARVSDATAFFSTTEAGQPGRLIEMGPTERIFSDPLCDATRDYINGKFG